jgi:hypothetical protein
MGHERVILFTEYRTTQNWLKEVFAQQAFCTQAIPHNNSDHQPAKLRLGSHVDQDSGDTTSFVMSPWA